MSFSVRDSRSQDKIAAAGFKSGQRVRASAGGRSAAPRLAAKSTNAKAAAAQALLAWLAGGG